MASWPKRSVYPESIWNQRGAPSSGEPSMRPDDVDGGGGCWGGGAPAARTREMESMARTGADPDLEVDWFAADAGTSGGGFGAPATMTPAMDSGDHMPFAGSDDYAREILFHGGQFESVDIVGTQFNGQFDWPIPDAEDGQGEAFVDDETDSNHYEDFLVRCEGDTDVEECFPMPVTREEVIVEEVRPRIREAKLPRIRRS